MSKIKVSVLCLAYNHERYIRKCLEGFIMQKTDFAFEVLINDDASTDKTAAIIKEFEEKYPDIIKPTYQTENQHSKGVRNTQTFLLPRVTGEYVAFCEGDDYWIDPYKLQKQVDALEQHKDCYLCVHGVEIIDEAGEPLGRCSPMVPLEEGEISSRRFMELICEYNFQTSCYMIRADAFKEYYRINPKFRRVVRIGDEPMLLYFGNLGNVFYVKRVMSRYRKGGVSSWNATFIINRKNEVRHCTSIINMLKEFDKYSNYVYHDVCKRRIKGMKRRRFHARMHVLFPKTYFKFYNWCKRVLKGEKI